MKNIPPTHITLDPLRAHVYQYLSIHNIDDPCSLLLEQVVDKVGLEGVGLCVHVASVLATWQRQQQTVLTINLEHKARENALG